jgi:hypothetical protein
LARYFARDAEGFAEDRLIAKSEFRQNSIEISLSAFAKDKSAGLAIHGATICCRVGLVLSKLSLIKFERYEPAD